MKSTAAGGDPLCVAGWCNLGCRRPVVYGCRHSAICGRWPSAHEYPLETGCCRSDLAGECRRAPIPDVGQLLGRLSAVRRNLTFGGGGAKACQRRRGEARPTTAPTGSERSLPTHFGHSAFSKAAVPLKPCSANWSSTKRPLTRSPFRPDPHHCPLSGNPVPEGRAQD